MTYDPPPLFTPPNLWRTVSVHGQPPANTLIDYVTPGSRSVGRSITPSSGGPGPGYSPDTRWRLSDLPPLDAVAPPPAPERPEPKFAPGASVLVNDCGRYTVDGPPEWDDGQWYYDLDGGEGGCPLPVGESALTAAPEPSIPIGGWFDPGDGRTLQRVENPYGDDGMEAAARIWHRTPHSWSSAAPTRCSPLTEREAMERLYPAGAWIADDTGDSGLVVGWEDGFGGPSCTAEWVRDGEMENSAGWIREHCTVLPGPTLTAPWRPLDELPTDWPDGKLLLVIDTEGKYRMRCKIDVRMYPSQFEAWADLDDVAPIPAHLRSTP